MATTITINSVGESDDVEFSGGVGHIELFGDLGGSRIRPEYSTDDGTSWKPFLRANGETLVLDQLVGINFELPACDIRVTAVGGDPDATAEVTGI